MKNAQGSGGEGGHRKEEVQERTEITEDEWHAPQIPPGEGKTNGTRGEDIKGQTTRRDHENTTGSPTLAVEQGGNNLVRRTGTRQEEDQETLAQQIDQLKMKLTVTQRDLHNHQGAYFHVQGLW